MALLVVLVEPGQKIDEYNGRWDGAMMSRKENQYFGMARGQEEMGYLLLVGKSSWLESITYLKLSKLSIMLPSMILRKLNE